MSSRLFTSLAVVLITTASALAAEPFPALLPSQIPAGTPADIKARLTELYAPERLTREKAVQELGRLGAQAQAAVPFVLSMPWAEIGPMFTVSTNGGPGVLPAPGGILAISRSESGNPEPNDPLPAVLAVQALAVITKDDPEPLLAFLRDPACAWRAKVPRVLGRLESPKAGAALIVGLKETDDEVRLACLNAIQRNPLFEGGKLRFDTAVLLPELSRIRAADPNPKARLTALGILGYLVQHRGLTEGAEALFAALEDNSEDVRLSAVRLLAPTKDARAVAEGTRLAGAGGAKGEGALMIWEAMPDVNMPICLAALRADDPTPTQRCWGRAAKALAQRQDAQAVDALLEMMASQEPSMRHRAVAAAPASADAKTRQLVLAGLDDKDHGVRLAAVLHTKLFVKDMEVARRLDLLSRSAEEDIRTTAEMILTQGWGLDRALIGKQAAASASGAPAPVPAQDALLAKAQMLFDQTAGQQAVYEVAKLGEAVVPVLQEFIRQGKNTPLVYQTLALTDGPAAAAALHGGMTSPHAGTRRRIVLMLIQKPRREPAVLLDLAWLAKRDPVPVLASEAFAALVKAQDTFPEIKAPKLTPSPELEAAEWRMVVAAIGDNEYNAGREAADKLKSAGPKAVAAAIEGLAASKVEFAQTLVTYLATQPSPEVANAISDYLWKHPGFGGVDLATLGEPFTELLINLAVKYPQPAGRTKALARLCALPPGNARILQTAVVLALRDTDPNVRLDAVRRLGEKFDDPLVHQALEKAKQDGVAEVAAEAGRQLYKRGAAAQKAPAP